MNQSKIDLLTSTLEELGLSDACLQDINAAHVHEQSRRSLDLPTSLVPVSRTMEVADLLEGLVTPLGQRSVYRQIGRAAYGELCAELADLGLLPSRWGVGVVVAQKQYRRRPLTGRAVATS